MGPSNEQGILSLAFHKKAVEQRKIMRHYFVDVSREVSRSQLMLPCTVALDQ